MARNRKKDYIKKLLQIQTGNGYKIDIGNYLYNPSFDNEYPALKKKISETPERLTFSTVYFMKYYDGTAEYKQRIYSAPNNGESWNVVNIESERVIETAGRFNLNKLVQLAEAL